MKTAMYKGLIGTFLIASLAACASTPSEPSAQASAPQPKVVAQTKSVPPGCVASTGTRLQRSSGDCAGTGRSWTGDQLRRTGAMDAGQGLSLLDPSVTSSSH